MRSASASQLIPPTPPPTPASLPASGTLRRGSSLLPLVCLTTITRNAEPVEGVVRRPNKKRRMIATEEDEQEVAVDRMLVEEGATGGSNGSAPAKFLAGLRFYLHLVGAEHDALRATIKRYRPPLEVHAPKVLTQHDTPTHRCGGRVSGRFGSTTTHVLTSALLAGAEDEALRVARKINPRLLVVTADWLRKCVQRNRLLSTSAA